MTAASDFSRLSIFLLGLAFTSLADAQLAIPPSSDDLYVMPSTPGLSDSHASAQLQDESPPPPADPATDALQEAIQLARAHQYADALVKINAVLQLQPHSLKAYILRGNIEASLKQWDSSEKDYETAQLIDGTNVIVKINLAEIKFKQGEYDAVRPNYVTLGSDPEYSDYAAYKVFLCDLFGKHEDVAMKELDAFNQVGSQPSYYYGNAAWCLVHHKTEDARGWIASAVNIYSGRKTALYTMTLRDEGYVVALSDPSPSK